jgi:DNA-binding MarR family transcriptional regulator
MTGLVDRAEKRGLLQRAPSASDGRAVDVFLSREGQNLPSVSTPASDGHCPR